MPTREEMIRELRRRDMIAELEARDAAEPQVQAEPERPEEAWYEDLAEGVVASGMDTYYGVKDLVSDLDEEDRARLQDWKDDAGQSGWGTAGRVIGEIGQLAIPGGAGLKAARALSAAGKMAKTAKALPLASDIAGSAGLGYVQLPDDSASRGQEAFQGGAAALVGGGLGRAIAPLIRGVKGTKITEKLRDEGVKLTPGRMKGGFMRGAENFGEYLVPSLSKAIQKAKVAADEGMELQALRRIGAPNPDSLLTSKIEKFIPDKSGWDGIAQVQNVFNKGYDKAWGAGNRLSQSNVPFMKFIAEQGRKGLGKKDRRALSNIIDDVTGTVKQKPDITPKELDEVLRNYISGKSKKYKLDAVIKDLRGTLRTGLPSSNKTALSKLDEAWPRMVAMENATGTTGASLNRGIINPKNLTSGAKRGSSRSKYARGDEPFQRYAADWSELKGKPAGMLMSASRRFVQMFPALPGLRQTGDLLAGNYKTQARIRKMLQEEMADKLRTGVSTARLGGAYEGDTY